MGRLKISKYSPSIFQGKLDFSSARSVSVASEYPHEHALLRGLLVVLAALCVAYLYFVGASVLNVVARKEAVAESQRFQSSIATMEQQLFALSDSVDRSIAGVIGLQPIEGTAYVYTPGREAAAVTIGGNGI